MQELPFQPVVEIARRIREKDLSPIEVLDAHIAQIERLNPKLNAIVTTMFDQARRDARAAEEKLMRGNGGPLLGVPVTVKDTIELAGVRCAAGSRLREAFQSHTDAPVVTRLRAAGAIILGKTNTPECALDFRTDNAVFGRTSNPWNTERVPGGSSGGEAAAIASGCSAAGVGSDLAGSIRFPAHCCGITGLKPTPGRIPSSGHFPPILGVHALGTSIGPMARTVGDLRLLLEVLAGPDADDPVSVPLPCSDRPPDIRGLGVMWYADDGVTPVTQATRETVERAAIALADFGFRVTRRRPAGIEQVFEMWYGFLGEGGLPSILRMYDGREELAGRLINGLRKTVQAPPHDRFMANWFARDMLRASLLDEMSSYPILLAPVAPFPAFPHEHRGPFEVEGRSIEYLRALTYTMFANLVALPAVALPAGRSPEGLPIGVQLIGRPFEEEALLEAAAALEHALGGFQAPG